MPAAPGVRRQFFPKPYADTVAKLRVFTGFLMVGMFLWLARPDPYSLAYGIPVMALGAFVRGWAAGHLRKNQNLTTGGPYSMVRNPLYVGTAIAAIGMVIAAQRWQLAIVTLIVFAFVYLPVIELEEQHLTKLFPEFAKYQARVPMLLPQFKHRTRGSSAFSWSQYMKNREYEAGLGIAAAAGFLVWRMLS